MENRRHRILLVILIVLAIVTVTWTVGEPMLINPIKEDKQQLASLRTRYAELEVAKDVREPAAVNRWRALAAKTLSLDPTVATNVLKREMEVLGTTSGLERPRFRPGPIRRSRRFKGAAIVSVTVTARSSLTPVTNFLAAVHSLPYLVRLDRVQVRRAPSGRTKTKKEVTLTATVESLVLPIGTENRRFVRGPVETFPLPSDPSQLPQREPPALARAAADYAVLEGKNPFHGADPPPPPQVVRKQPARRTPTRRTPAKRPTPRNRGRAATDPATHTEVAGTLSYPPSQFVSEGRREVILRDTRSNSKQRSFFGLGDDLELRDNRGGTHSYGKIIFIHPYGMVTQQGAEMRFYQKGQPLSNYEVLDENRIKELELWQSPAAASTSETVSTDHEIR